MKPVYIFVDGFYLYKVSNQILHNWILHCSSILDIHTLRLSTKKPVTKLVSVIKDLKPIYRRMMK